MVSNTPSEARHRDGSAGLRAIAAVAALLLAAGLLALGVSASDRDSDSPTEVAVVPGKVSVLDDAKVREWNGQTFGIEVPLDWERTVSAAAKESGSGEQFQRHQWALANGTGEQAADAGWLTAREGADARLTLDIRRYQEQFAAERWARLLADSKSAERGYRFGDVGPVTIGAAADGAGGIYGWRLNVAAGDDLETHYFFITCDGAKPRESWHVTFNRRSVREMQPVLQSTLQSLNTEFQPAKAAGCT